MYEVLIRRYNPRMYRVARAILHEDPGVEDVMQEAYLKAFTALPQFAGRALFVTWLTRILVNCALAHMRRRSRLREVAWDTVESRGTAAVAEGVDPSLGGSGELRLSQAQIGRLIEEIIDALPAKHRVVFVMRELEKMSVSETAASLGISPANVKVRLHRAKRLLKEVLRARMPDISPYSFSGTRCDEMTRRVMAGIASPATGKEACPGEWSSGAEAQWPGNRASRDLP